MNTKRSVGLIAVGCVGLVAAVLLGTGCGDDLPARADGVTVEPVCASRAGRDYGTAYTALPGDSCGPIFGGGAHYTDPSTACDTTQAGETYSLEIHWSPDGARGDGILVYRDHFSSGLGTTCDGSYAVVYSERSR